MSEKPVAALVAALAIAPICAVCILGPAFVGSALAWIFGWFAGPGVIGLTIFVMALGVSLFLTEFLRLNRVRFVDLIPSLDDTGS